MSSRPIQAASVDPSPVEEVDTRSSLPDSRSPIATQTREPALPTASNSSESDDSEESSSDDADNTAPTPISDESELPTSSGSDTRSPTSSTSSYSSSSTSSTTRGRPEKTTPKVESTRTKPLTSAATGLPDDKEDKHNKDGGGGLPVTTYVGIALGCVGFLVLLMALTAYYRRWRRRREVARQSFANAPAPAATVPPSPAETTVSEKEHPRSPDWADAPAMPAMPAAYQHLRTSSLPEPGSEPTSALMGRQSSDHSGRSSRSGSRHSRGMSGLAIPRRSLAPISIETSGDSRLFSRPVSEVVLEGRRPESSFSQASSAFSDPRTVKGSKARHNSYASSQHESLALPSTRNTLRADRFSGNYI